MFGNAVCFLVVVSCMALQSVHGKKRFHQVVIVGAGPGGLQLAHYLESAHRDYVVIEAAGNAGSFFERNPRFRELISINKRFLEHNGLDFAMRHDWNSLLSDVSHVQVNQGAKEGHQRGWASSSSSAAQVDDVEDERLLMRAFSKDFYPNAGELASYLQSFQQIRGLNVHFNTTVSTIRRASASERSSSPSSRFALETTSSSSTSDVYFAEHVVICTGLTKAVFIPGISDVEGVQGYGDAPVDIEEYAGQRVAVIGRGNAAFEIASHALERAALVHIMGTGPQRVRLAYETHYPGDVRVEHARLLETYMLKSLDGMVELPPESISVTREVDAKGKVSFQVGPKCSGRCGLRKRYDRVVVCAGSKFDDSIFDASLNVAMHPEGKFPLMTARFESVSTPGIWFAGTLAHALDYKKSSGGFVHGLRYSARALYRILEQEGSPSGLVDGESAGKGSKSPTTPIRGVDAALLVEDADEFGIPGVETEEKVCGEGTARCGTRWPRRLLPSAAAAANFALHRLNSASGLYQMFGHLVDVFVLGPPGSGGDGYGRSWVHLEEVPAPLAPRLARQVHADLHGNLPDEQVYGSLERPDASVEIEERMDLMKKRRAELGHYNVEIMNAGSNGPFADIANPLRAYHKVYYDRHRDVVPLTADEQRLDRAMNAAGLETATWVELALEYGQDASLPARDAFHPLRASIPSDQPQLSHFMHPIIRLKTASSSPASATTLQTHHLVEDFLTEFNRVDEDVEPIVAFFHNATARGTPKGDHRRTQHREESTTSTLSSTPKTPAPKPARSNPTPPPDFTDYGDDLPGSTGGGGGLFGGGGGGGGGGGLFGGGGGGGGGGEGYGKEEAQDATCGAGNSQPEPTKGPRPRARRRSLTQASGIQETIEQTTLIRRLQSLGARVTSLWVGGRRVGPSDGIPKDISRNPTVVALLWDKSRALGLRKKVDEDPEEARAQPTVAEMHSRGVHLTFSGISRRLSTRYPDIPFVDINVGTSVGLRLATRIGVRTLPIVNVLHNGALALSLSTSSLVQLDATLYTYFIEFSGSVMPKLHPIIPEAKGNEIGTDAATIILENELESVENALDDDDLADDDRAELRAIRTVIKGAFKLGEEEGDGLKGHPKDIYKSDIPKLRGDVQENLRNNKEATNTIQ